MLYTICFQHQQSRCAAIYSHLAWFISFLNYNKMRMTKERISCIFRTRLYAPAHSCMYNIPTKLLHNTPLYYILWTQGGSVCILRNVCGWSKKLYSRNVQNRGVEQTSHGVLIHNVYQRTRRNDHNATKSTIFNFAHNSLFCLGW